MIYTGIGSRKCPKSIQYIMTIFAYSLNETLRSGGADGADTAFEIGSVSKEIYLPSKGFNGNDSNLIVTEFDNFKDIYDVAEAVHPKWSACDDYAKLLHTRNVCQVLGKDLNKPSDMLICWTTDGANNRTYYPSSLTGGTATAIKLAGKFDIMVLNLLNIDDLKIALDLVSDLGFETNFAALADTIDQDDLNEALNLLELAGC